MAKEEDTEDTPAKRAVLREYGVWLAQQSDPAHPPDAILFFTYLQRERPGLLLDFRTSGDKWQTIHGWLLRERRVNE